MLDIHCHLEYMKNADEVVAQAQQRMSALITSAADPKDAEKALGFAERYKGFVFASLGMHPSEVKYSQQQIDDYMEFIRNNAGNIIAIGEVGLDYYRTKEEEKQERQRHVFLQFISLAKELKLPLVIHSRNGERNAATECIDMLASCSVPVILHCFSGSSSNLKRALASGFWISYATNICNSEKHKRLAAETPVESMLLETDAPWLSPFKDAKPTNDTKHSQSASYLNNVPWNIIESAKTIAQVKDMPAEEILSITEKNARRAFGV